MNKKGLILIYTGNGKGKTTAAFGQAMRAAGNGLKVCIIQFIKGKWRTGESRAVDFFGDRIELYTTGTGFTWEAENRQQVIDAVRKGWDLAVDKIRSDSFDMIILDEITYPILYGILSASEVLSELTARPKKLHIILTGRDAGEELITAADLVTEMREIKHHYTEGITAEKGIEY